MDEWANRYMEEMNNNSMHACTGREVDEMDVVKPGRGGGTVDGLIDGFSVDPS